MQGLFRAFSKMVVVLVLLFGNPPPVTLRQLARRPAVALVATARRPVDGLPPLGLPAPSAAPMGEGAIDQDDARFAPAGRAYLPVQAA